VIQERHSHKNTLVSADDPVHARLGDRQAFSRLMEPYRRELIAYCYRLTGALAESEDLVQEAFVRAYRARDGFEGRATPRAWIYRIAHNLCLNHVLRRPQWESWENLAEGVLSEPPATEREDVRLGFVALVQSLPPRQRATLVLRDVLGWSAEETARILETTVPAVKNALTRARQTLARQPHGGDPAQVHDLSAAGPEAQALLAAWVDAFEKGNTPRMVALLTAGETGYNQSEKDAVHVKEAPRTGRSKSARAREREERADAQR
jgi:RNA polymerase sigma-70 factor (ECF subfamily)